MVLRAAIYLPLVTAIMSKTVLQNTSGQVILSASASCEISNTAKRVDKIKQRSLGPSNKGAQELAGLYSKGKRVQEQLCVCVCITLMLSTLLLMSQHVLAADLLLVLVALLVGVLTADFVGGFVHWAADTWGSVDIPVFGKHFIRPFREHHLDPTSITRHDFVETNGDNFMGSIPMLAYLTYALCAYSREDIQTSFSVYAYVYAFAVFVAFTNQTHKWSHTYYGLPAWVVTLQDLHIVLPRRHHRVHHVAPHDTYYCITTGWLNYPLELLGFWGALERGIEWVTGARPRDDDMKWGKRS